MFVCLLDKIHSKKSSRRKEGSSSSSASNGSGSSRGRTEERSKSPCNLPNVFIFIDSHVFFAPVRRTFSPPPPRASSIPLYLVLYDYDPQEESELKLRAGDLVTKTDEEAGWFEGTNQTSGVSGWYSPAYVRIASSK